SLISASFAASASNSTSSNVEWAGFRYSMYGAKKNFGKIPSADSVNGYVNKIKNHFDENTKGALLLTISSENNGKCVFDFPQPSTVTNSTNIKYSKKDQFEKLLSKCDEEGINVWLVVEPGNNDLVDLANIVLDKYGNHESVQGFGASLEWYYRNSKGDGKRLTNSEAERVVNEIRKRNENYTFLAKHWNTKYLPENYTDGMVFALNPNNFEDFSHISAEFKHFAKSFSKSPVIFEIGYGSDRHIWKDDPISFAKSITSSASRYNEHIGIIWTDFTMREALEKM
ncbi:hypothetical protein PIROE2DRAFT_5479, partial [Piromyces sp. E2]